MSSTLFIKHLCAKLTTEKREDLLRHFGAQKVWFINSNSHTAFASFRSKSDAEQALFRLHQLEILGKRLTVEYANDTNDPLKNDCFQKDCKQVKEFIDQLNSWNPSIDLLHPPNPSLNYKYPSATPHILFNVMFELQKNEKFYTQTIHLMNKIGLDPPFHNVQEDVKSFIRSCLHIVDVKLPEPQPPSTNIISNKNNLSSEESEMSSNDENPLVTEIPTHLPRKRSSNVRKINKKPRLMHLTLCPERKKTNALRATEVFEETSLQEFKKIEVKVNKTQMAVAIPTVCDRIEIVGTIGKIDPIPLASSSINRNENRVPECENDDESKNHKSNNENATITSKELLENKISLKDMKSLPIFKNYHPGTPSMRLYIKNLSKEVDSTDIERIYKRYVADCDFSELAMFNVRVMQEGRMKGQAFVSLPSVELSERAVSETNGYLLKNKPMVVQFARTTK